MSSTAGAISTPVSRQLVAVVAQAALSLLIALSLVMLARRLGGAFVQPLSASALLAISLALVAIMAFVRLLLSASIVRSRLLYVLPGIAAILLLSAFTLRGTPAVAVTLAWFLVIASEGASWIAAYRPEVLLRRAARPNINRVATEVSDVEHEGEFPTGLVQQLMRVREVGRESVHATMLAEIPANDRQAALHIAFCPPLDAAPELTAHALDADDAEVRITQAETFGARIEVRLPATSGEKRGVLVELLGSASACRTDE